ncbi:hypothetical protein HK104_004297 [Borealophlyctis nickersoniae]|nr:hypothetical protein HK104_004297 [Borealophlyctis nickersoniae]
MASGPRFQEGLRVISAYAKRSLEYVKDEAIAVVKFDTSWKKEMPMFKFDSVENLEQWTVGSDANIGGKSEAYWGLTPQKTALFWGTLSSEIPEGVNISQSGYAGIRSKPRPYTLFHRPTFDTTHFRYLAVRAKGDTKQWFVNLKTPTTYDTYLWQHRLYFQRPGEWEIILIPFRDFVLTSHGYVQRRQPRINRGDLKSVGFSLVRQPGDFSLELDWIKAVNTPNTWGDVDMLGEGEYMDKDGNVRRLAPGQTLWDLKKRPIQWFADSPKEDKS